MDTDFITPADVSEITGLSTASLAQLRSHGTGPMYYKPTAKTILYRRSEVIAWIEDSARISTGRTTATALA